MNINNEDLGKYIELLENDINQIDNIPEEIIDNLIEYLQIEIAKKEKILYELEKN